MKLNDWLDAEKGRTTSLANLLGITVSAITQWRTTGIPKRHMFAVRSFTKGEVTIEEMIPEVGFKNSSQVEQVQANSTVIV